MYERTMHNAFIKQKKPVKQILNDLYELKVFRLKRPFPIQIIELRTFVSNNRGVLQLSLRTPLEYYLISNAIQHSKLNGIKECHSNYHQYFIWELELKKHYKKDLEVLFNGIFNQLILLTDDTETKVRLANIHNELSLAVKKHFWILNKNFYIPKHYVEYEIDTPNSKGAKALFNAISHSNIDAVYELLSNNADPNAYYERFSALNYAIDLNTPLYPTKGSKLSERLSIIALLLEYGANPMLETYGLTTFERTVNASIFESMFKFSGINVEYFDQIMQFLTASVHSNPHIPITDKAKKTYHGFVVDGCNMFLKNIHQKPQKSPKIFDVNYEDGSLHFYLSDKMIITVTSVSEYDLAQNKKLYNDLFNLFKSTFDWKKNFKDDEMKLQTYFNKLLPNSTGIVDCIYMNDTLVGMNIADITTRKYNGKIIMLHYIKLAAATRELTKYNRFMSVISFSRGFALQKNTPQVNVITYYEAASASSYLQTSNLDMYPKFKTLENLMKEIANDLYAPEDLITHKSLYIKDDLAIAKPSRPPISFFWTENELANKGFEERYQADKQSLLIGFINNEANLQKLARKINHYCTKDADFNQIVDYYSKVNNGLTSTAAKL